MNKLRKYFPIYGLVILGLIAVVGVTYAAFVDKADVLGATFSIGSADLKFMIDPQNYVDQLNGPSFLNIGQNWRENYTMKLVNNGTTKLALSSNANYETANDPEEIRQYIYAELFDWNDVNNDNLFNEDEKGNSWGKKTILKWKTEGINLGSFEPGQVKPLVVSFSTSSISDTKQGATGIFDFIFEAIETQ